MLDNNKKLDIICLNKYKICVELKVQIIGYKLKNSNYWFVLETYFYILIDFSSFPKFLIIIVCIHFILVELYYVIFIRPL